jgi:hypothetical protein
MALAIEVTKESVVAKQKDRNQSSILGDINPIPSAKDHVSGSSGSAGISENDESMDGGSRHDRTEHAGSRDLTQNGGVGTEVGGTRNYRQGTGATGGDLGNRPE